MKDYKEIDQIIEYGKLLHELGYVAACDGNISFRPDAHRMVITPTGRHKRWLEREELAMTDMGGNAIRGFPSSETMLHLAIYNVAHTARFIIHAHPPHAVAWSVAFPDDTELPIEAVSEAILGVGRIPIIPYAKPGTGELSRAVEPFVRENRVLIMARHGAISWGESLREAFNGMERLEHTAMILCKAKAMGNISKLPEEELEFLYQKRKEGGLHSR